MKPYFTPGGWPKLTSREKANNWFMKASRVVWLGVKVQEELLKIGTGYKE